MRKTGCEPKCSRRLSSSCFLQNTRRTTHAVKAAKSLVGDNKKKENLNIKQKINAI